MCKNMYITIVRRSKYMVHIAYMDRRGEACRSQFEPMPVKRKRFLEPTRGVWCKSNPFFRFRILTQIKEEMDIEHVGFIGLFKERHLFAAQTSLINNS